MKGLQILVLIGIMASNYAGFGQWIVTRCEAGLVSYHKTDRADGLCSDLVMPYHVYHCQEYVVHTHTHTHTQSFVIYANMWYTHTHTHTVL